MRLHIQKKNERERERYTHFLQQQICNWKQWGDKENEKGSNDVKCVTASISQNVFKLPTQKLLYKRLLNAHRTDYKVILKKFESMTREQIILKF